MENTLVNNGAQYCTYNQHDIPCVEISNITVCTKYKNDTYVDSEGIGWSISFSDIGDSGYGCTRGCVMPSSSR